MSLKTGRRTFAITLAVLPFAALFEFWDLILNHGIIIRAEALSCLKQLNSRQVLDSLLRSTDVQKSEITRLDENLRRWIERHSA
jgi:hypothetical protein